MQLTTSFHRENYVNYRWGKVFWLFIAQAFYVEIHSYRGVSY